MIFFHKLDPPICAPMLRLAERPGPAKGVDSGRLFELSMQAQTLTGPKEYWPGVMKPVWSNNDRDYWRRTMSDSRNDSYVKLLKWLVRIVFVLLATHFTLAYTADSRIISEIRLMLRRRQPRQRPIFFSLPNPSRTQKFIKDGDQRLLWGGEDRSRHFDITKTTIDPAKLNYRYGAEIFQGAD